MSIICLLVIMATVMTDYPTGAKLDIIGWIITSYIWMLIATKKER